jgi:4-diphosphocytidyl-2C-methyl-D-erythritol kinase
MALNRLWNLNLSRQELQSIGLKLGADVPFFLCGHSAWVSGIGEIITPLTGRNALPQQQFLVVKPEQGWKPARFFQRAPETRHKACYSCGLRCKSLRLWPKRPAAGR